MERPDLDVDIPSGPGLAPKRTVGNASGTAGPSSEPPSAELSRSVARDRSRLRIVGWVGAVVVAVIVFLGSASPDAGGMLSGLPVGSDKVAHGLAYAALAGFLTLGSGRPRLAVLLAVMYGLSDEFHQSFVPTRTPDAYDLVADAIGALVGAWAVGFLQRRTSPRQIE